MPRPAGWMLTSGRCCGPCYPMNNSRRTQAEGGRRCDKGGHGQRKRALLWEGDEEGKVGLDRWAGVLRQGPACSLGSVDVTPHPRCGRAEPHRPALAAATAWGSL